jgi:hypothetical protein
MKLYLDYSQLEKLALEQREPYLSATPFPHAVLDNVLPEEALDLVLREFPDPQSAAWKEYQNYHEKKLEIHGEERLGDDVSLILYQFNSAPFLRFLEKLTGIDKLLSDPYFFGGGLHLIPDGGKLGIHADFSRHPDFQLDRRVNVLVYLNKGWREEFGGHLELWNEDMTECVRRILPVYNRMVVFTITDWAFHGHPHALTCPPGTNRKSIALYYYTVGRPKGELIEGKKWTLFMPRPGETVPEDTLNLGYTYRGRRGEKPLAVENRPDTKQRTRKPALSRLVDFVSRMKSSD